MEVLKLPSAPLRPLARLSSPGDVPTHRVVSPAKPLQVTPTELVELLVEQLPGLVVPEPGADAVVPPPPAVVDVDTVVLPPAPPLDGYGLGTLVPGLGPAGSQPAGACGA